MTVEHVVELHAAAEAARGSYEDAAALLHHAVADALADGVAATAIAEALGVSRVRVYQLRDKARRD